MTTTEERPTHRSPPEAGREGKISEADAKQKREPNRPGDSKPPTKAVLSRRTLLMVAVAAGLLLLALLAIRGAAASNARREAAAFQAQILSVTPAREIIVMNADAAVIGKAQKRFITGTSELWYTSRAKFIYSLNMRAISQDNFAYDKTADILTIKIPKMQVQFALYGPRERIASLAPFRTERGTGNELERLADADLQKNAYTEASRPALITAAVKAAKYEIGALYEDAFRAAGRKTRVVIVSNGEADPPGSDRSAAL